MNSNISAFKLITVSAGISVFVFVLFLFYFVFREPVSSFDSKEVELRYIDNISLAHDTLIKKFNKEYKGKIKIVPINLPFTKFSTNERKELLARTLRSRTDAVDIFSVDLIWVPRFARWGEPLDNFFPVTDRNKFIPEILKSCFFENHMVASPFYIDIGLIYYRKDIFLQLPDSKNWIQKLDRGITWQELLNLRQCFSRPFYLFAGKDFEGLICSYIEGVLAAKPDLFERQYIDLTDESSRKNLKILVDLIHSFQITPVEITKFDEVRIYRYAMEHNTPIFRGWPGFLWSQKYEIPAPIQGQIIPAPVPHFKGVPQKAVFGGWNLMISKFSKHKNEAIEFLRFIHREDNQELMYQTGGLIPVAKSVYSDSVFTENNPELVKYQGFLKNGIHRPYRVDYTRISDVMSHYINLALLRKISVDEALMRATGEINGSKTKP